MFLLILTTLEYDEWGQIEGDELDDTKKDGKEKI